MKRIAYLFAAAVMVLSAASCLKDNGSVDSMPGCSSEQYLMTIVNDSNVKTVWYIAEKGKDAANPGALPSEKPARARSFSASNSAASERRVRLAAIDAEVSSV